ncbi:MAG: hypothetical protein QOJ38_1386 [Solirubrobacterales bacterium]|jgi:hypothetical protein|nr:hypothetical protein [Solirubrobacterales bacterium]
MPQRTREAMLRGIRRNRIIAGAYADKDSGGVCPMLAAHRNGGRTDFGRFAIAWDEFTGEIGATRPRRATIREVSTLLNYLELSLLDENAGRASLRETVAQIRSDRRRAATDAAHATEQPDLTPLLETPDVDIERPEPIPEPFPEPIPEPTPPPEVEPFPDPVPEPYPEPAQEPQPIGLGRDGDPVVERILDEVLLSR